MMLLNYDYTNKSFTENYASVLQIPQYVPSIS